MAFRCEICWCLVVPPRYRKPTRLLTRACSPRMASSVTLRAVLGIQISLLCTRDTCRFGNYPISFSTELHYNVCTNDPTQHFDWTGCRRIWSKHRTTGDILLVVESSSRQEPTRSNKVKGCETIACKHMNSRHSATYRCDLCMAQTLRLLLHQTQKKNCRLWPSNISPEGLLMVTNIIDEQMLLVRARTVPTEYILDIVLVATKNSRQFLQVSIPI